MTSFAHPVHSTEHIGAARTARAVEGARTVAASKVRTTATLLLAAVVSLLLVIGNQMVDTWTEEHLLAAWVVLWVIGFSALALLASPARAIALRLDDVKRTMAIRRRAAANDRRMWSLAQTDPRVMADINRAMTRNAAQEVRGFH